MQVIVLGSTSKYRAELLARLGLPFEAARPDCDETPQQSEKPRDLVLRLAKTKAASLKNDHPQNIIIGSDQVCSLDGQVLGQPGTVERAVEQLRSMRGQSIVFYTGLCVLDAASGERTNTIDETVVVLRDLCDAEIDRYIGAEMPLDCAGSFMVEKLGISLFDRVESNDPTALIGLPLIALCKSLRHFGISVP